MNAKLNFQIIFFLLIFSKSFSQITLTLDQIYLNNQTSIQNCNTVDFGTTADNYLVFYYTLEKNVNQAVTDGTIRISLKYNSTSSGVIKNSTLVASSLWNLSDQYSSTIPTNILASEIQVSGSSILLEFIEGGSTYKSCEYPLIKTQVPEFQILPSSVNLSCGSTSTTNFSAWNKFSSPGTPSYSWNVGNGWSLPDGTPVSGTLATTSSSVQLKPSSGTTLPSNVNLTVTLNGIQYYDTAPVTRSTFNPKYLISGISDMCTSATYSINNLASGLTVTWSSSNNFIASINQINNSQATLTKVGNGIVTISATVQNACGQQQTFTKNVIVGSADVGWLLFSNGVGETEYFCTSHTGNTYEILPKISGSTHQVRIKEYPSLNVVYTSSINAGNLGTLNYTPLTPGWYIFEARRMNSCGTTAWLGAEVEFVDCTIGGGGGEMEFRVYPNPTSETLTISKNQTKKEENTSELKKDGKDLYELYDYNGSLIDNGFINNEINIDVSNYKKGRYFLKINSSEKPKIHQIIIE